MASVGDILVSISLDVSDLKKNIQKVEKELQGLRGEFDKTSKDTEKATGKMAKALGGVFSSFAGTQLISGLGNVVGDILNTTGEIQAQGEQYEQVMGKMKSASDKYIDEMANRWNKHPSELQNALMQYNAILKGKGVSEEEAFNLSKTMLERTVDANAFANEDMASTTDRFMAMVKGEYDSLDTAMVNLSATMLNDKAQEKYGKKWDELTVSQQEQLKVQESVRQHTSAGVLGQGEREADSYANEVAKLKKTFDEFKEALGSPIIGTFSDILGGISTSLKELSDWFSGLPAPVQEFTAITGIATVALIGLGLALGGIAFALGAIATVAGVGVGVVAGISAIVVAVVAVIAGLVYLIVKYWDEIKEWTVNAWNTISEKTAEIWNAIKTKASEIWNALKEWFVEFFAGLAQWFSDTWTSIKDKAVELWTNLIDSVSEVIATIYEKSGLQAVVDWIVNLWNVMVETIKIVLEMLQAIFIAIWNKILQFILPILNKISTFITNAWNKIKEITSKVFNAIKDFFVNIWNKVYNFLAPIVGKIRDSIKNAWDKVKEFTSSIFNKVKSTISGVWENIKSTIKDKVSGVYNNVKETFNNVKDAIMKPINKAKELVSNAVDKIKGFFDFDWSLPKPKLPKISVSKGEKEILGTTIPYPKFKIDWNAKGNIFNGASILGGGQGVGEAGAEVVMPIEHKRYMQPFASAIAGHLKDDKNASDRQIVQNITINSPEPLTPSTVARQTLQASRKLAREWG